MNLTDAVFILRALFQGGPQPTCGDAADADDSGGLNISDPIYLLQHLFQGQAAPPPPGPAACGPDPTADDLACAGAAGC